MRGVIIDFYLFCAIVCSLVQSGSLVLPGAGPGAGEGVLSNNSTQNADSSEFQGVLIQSDEFRRFATGIEVLQDGECKLAMNATLWGIVQKDQRAIAMYDASAKQISGIEYGLVYNFGHYDQCMELNQEEAANASQPGFKTKYCLAKVTIEGVRIQKIASRKHQSENSTIVNLGQCFPASCSAEEIQTFLETYLQRIVVVNEHLCQVQKKAEITRGQLIYLYIFMSFVALAFASTLYHFVQICNHKGKTAISRDSNLDIALKSFSVIENIKKICQTPRDQLGLKAISGIKALAMITIIFGHALSFVSSGPVYNEDFMEKNLKMVRNGYLINSLLFVDVFLLLSGFLFSRILLIELKKCKGRINIFAVYIGRYIRLTPSYMAVIGFYMTWLTAAGNGPIWNTRMEIEQDRCLESWWLNILYVNNYVKSDSICMFQSWYLSVDTQLFILAPILIFSFYKSRTFGFLLSFTLLTVATAVPLCITYFDNLDPTLLAYPDEVVDLGSNRFYVETYIKTHMRAAVYIIGVLTGFAVYIMHEKNIKLSRRVVDVLWVVSTIIGAVSMLSVIVFYNKPYDNLESSMYSAFHKVGWGLSIAWLVVALTTGHATGLEKILSHQIWAPISRLTYSAYLCNGVVELFHAARIRIPTHMSTMDLTHETSMHVADTFILALVICLLFESPILALERIIFRSRRKPTHPTTGNSTPSTSEENIA